MKSKEKSLCESCSNRVVIKFHGKNIRNGISEDDCFYNFTVRTSDSRYELGLNGAAFKEVHVAHVIVDECSFYNKTNERSKKTNDLLESDSNTYDNNNSTNGVTFVNIPGALLP